jgi:hypothetical protein
MKEIEKRRVTFSKGKRYNRDEWNDQTDRLAVKGRDKQAKQVCVMLEMKIPVGRDLTLFGIDKFHLNSLDNLGDTWSRVQQAA